MCLSNLILSLPQTSSISNLFETLDRNVIHATMIVLDALSKKSSSFSVVTQYAFFIHRIVNFDRKQLTDVSMVYILSFNRAYSRFWPASKLEIDAAAPRNYLSKRFRHRGCLFRWRLADISNVTAPSPFFSQIMFCWSFLKEHIHWRTERSFRIPFNSSRNFRSPGYWFKERRRLHGYASAYICSNIQNPILKREHESPSFDWFLHRCTVMVTFITLIC